MLLFTDDCDDNHDDNDNDDGTYHTSNYGSISDNGEMECCILNKSFSLVLRDKKLFPYCKSEEGLGKDETEGWIVRTRL